ncbi:hypothetical protein ACF0H5_019504 [Mactra antiquata]
MADYTRCVGNLTVFLIGILAFTVSKNVADEVVLLDTTANTVGKLNWTTKVIAASPPDPTNTGLLFDEENIRYFDVLF